jgi:hypothetical protein
MQFRQYLHVIGLAALLTVGPATGQEIRVIDSAGDYLLKLDGTIKSGDRLSLINTIQQQNAFPQAIQLEATGGDVAEAMAIGRFVRNGMLATAAGDRCDGACFLVWVGGVRRQHRAGMNIALDGLDPADADQLRNYLFEMEVSERLAAKILHGTETELSAEQIGEQIGDHSPAYREWLESSCGGLTRQEFDDWQAINALNAVEASLGSMGMGGGNAAYNVDPQTQQLAARAREMTPEEKAAVTDKQDLITQCQEKAIGDARATLLTD